MNWKNNYGSPFHNGSNLRLSLWINKNHYVVFAVMLLCFQIVTTQKIIWFIQKKKSSASFTLHFIILMIVYKKSFYHQGPKTSCNISLYDAFYRVRNILTLVSNKSKRAATRIHLFYHVVHKTWCFFQQ